MGGDGPSSETGEVDKSREGLGGLISKKRVGERVPASERDRCPHGKGAK